MTVTVKVHVNGNYRATVVRTVDGKAEDPLVINPQEERIIPFWHGHKNEYEITEEYLGEKKE